MDKWGPFLEVGNVVLLRQCTVFSFISVQKYLNITLPNVLYVFNNDNLTPSPELIKKHISEVRQVNAERLREPAAGISTPLLITPNKPLARSIRPRSQLPTITPTPPRASPLDAYRRFCPPKTGGAPSRPVVPAKRAGTEDGDVVKRAKPSCSEPDETEDGDVVKRAKPSCSEPDETEDGDVVKRAKPSCSEPDETEDGDVVKRAKPSCSEPDETEEINKLLEDIGDEFYEDLDL